MCVYCRVCWVSEDSEQEGVQVYKVEDAVRLEDSMQADDVEER